jgi:hypothetical protein
VSDSVFAVLEMVLVFGLVVGWGVRELVLLRRDKQSRAAGSDRNGLEARTAASRAIPPPVASPEMPRDRPAASPE